MNENIQQLCDALTALGVSECENLLPKLGIDHHFVDAHNIALLAPGERKQFGDLLHLAGRITSSQLEEALADQARSGKKLGEILVERMLISEHEMNVLLAFQKNQSQEVKSVKKLQLGNLLVAMGEITQDQLNHALDWQIKYGGKLGAALIATGHANTLQIKKGVHLQSKLLIGLLLVAMAFASPLMVTNAYAGSQTGAIAVSTMVLPSARMQINHQAGQIHITAKDIAQGYVDVKAASLFTVATSRGTTYFIDVHPRSDIFSSVKIEGLGSQVILGSEGGSITQSGLGLRSPENVLNYRFMLKGDLQPGMYDWPLQLAVRV
jgi:hypothetical protein